MANVIPGTPASGTYVWYRGENKRGENGSITNPYDKFVDNAPESYLFIHRDHSREQQQQPYNASDGRI